MEIRISVRALVEFILRSGDIDNRKRTAPEGAMAEGGRIHRMIQRRMGAEYQAEVTLRFVYPAPSYDLVVEGRADGVIYGDSAEQKTAVIDEIKGTYRDLERMKEPVPVHLAQAKCYAYMYAAKTGRERMGVRMTYCQLGNGGNSVFSGGILRKGAGGVVFRPSGGIPEVGGFRV